MRWSVRQFFVLVLAVLVTAGLSLSNIQAATMVPTTQTTKMSMMAGMDNSGNHGCKMCDSGAGAGKAMTCSPICAGPLSASQETAPQSFIRQPMKFAALERWLTGRSQPPEPYPPRPFHIV